jgi:hypothetical protein
VQFNSAEAAARFAAMSRGGAAGGGNTVNNYFSPITVNSQATDANGIARDLKAAIERNSFAAQGNGGLQ